MRMRTLLFFALVAMIPAAQVRAEEAAMDGPAAKAFMQANQAMMDDMMAPNLTGDPDKDFATMMIPHHEGAIAMAKVVLQYGDDPDIRALAESIVKSQSDEVQWMKDWLAKQPK